MFYLNLPLAPIAQSLQALQQEIASLRQRLGLPAATNPAAAPAAGSSQAARPTGAPAVAAQAAPTLRSDEVYLLGGVEDRGEAGDDNSWLSSVLVYSPRSYSWRAGGRGCGQWELGSVGCGASRLLGHVWLVSAFQSVPSLAARCTTGTLLNPCVPAAPP